MTTTIYREILTGMCAKRYGLYLGICVDYMNICMTTYWPDMGMAYCVCVGELSRMLKKLFASCVINATCFSSFTTYGIILATSQHHTG